MENNVKNENKGNNEEIKKTNKIKEHFKRNKTRYIVAGTVITVVVIAGIAYVVGKKVGLKIGEAKALTINIEGGSTANIATNSAVQIVTTEIARRWNPQHVVKCVETGVVYPSIRFCAEQLGISRCVLMQHLKGVLDNAGSLHFADLGEFGSHAHL